MPNSSPSTGAHYAELLSPGRIGSLELRNRILMCPMGDNQATDGGFVTDQQIAYFEARAKGGAALLIVGSVGVTAPQGLSSPRQSAIGDDTFMEGWARLAERVHAHGSRLALQLVHNGKNAVEDIIAARPLLVPSLPSKSTAPDPLMNMLTADEIANMGTPAQVKGAKMMFREMTRDDIKEMVGAYADAVVRARDAGIDACELHAGHGYLIDNFLSPTTNRRSDEYGGSVENRARFLVEILEAIRSRVGTEYPVWCRINGEEVLIEGETIEDACRVAELAEAAGADAMHVSLYANPARGIGFTEAHSTHTPGRFLEVGAAVRARVGIPVITAGRLSPDEAELALVDGRADFVAMGRKLLADPELPNKLAAGDTSSIRPCIYHYRCISQIFVRANVRCAVNAQTGFESTRRLPHGASSGRILVVGGGPAGMEAARLAAARGFDITLADAGAELGGRFRIAAETSSPRAEFLAWILNEIESSAIKVQLEKKVDSVDIATGAYDQVIIATGGQWSRPDFAGVDRKEVLTVDDFPDFMRDLRQQSQSGNPIAIIGGNHVGLAMACFARECGADVVVLEESEVFAASNGLVGRWRYVHEAREMGIDLQGGAQILSVDETGIHWLDREGSARDSRVSKIVVTNHVEAKSDLAQSLDQQGLAYHSIGDGHKVRWLEGAIESAANCIQAL